MSKKMLINATIPEEDRVAIVEDGILTELDIEIASNQQTKGNIYTGEVVRVEASLQAAFIEYGASRPGFLQIGEIHPSLYPDRGDGNQRRPPINQILRRGQKILVQVIKEERGNKGAALTTEISLPGRYMVLMPLSDSRGISRKIENEQTRKELKQAMGSLDLPDNMGYIIRTAAIDQSPEELKRDFDYLHNIYTSIIEHSKKTSGPTLIYQESNLVLRSIRDYFSPEIDEVLIDDKKVFQEAKDFFKAVMPEYAHLVKLHQERRPIFARYQIEEQIAQLSCNTVTLPSGGSIVLDQTEALVAIDVNSARMSSEKDVEATAFKVNMEAATEIARQLRLRDMGGLIVIDFIDMRQRKNAREVEKALKTGLKTDKARVTVGRISHQFGLLEMSRQRIKANLGSGSYVSCPHCQGNGRIRSENARAIALLRRIQAGTAKGSIDRVDCTAPIDVANYLLNNKRHELLELEQRQHLKININAVGDFLPEQVEIEFLRTNKDDEDKNSNQEPLVDVNISERDQGETAVTKSAEGSDTPANGERKRSRRRRSGRRRSEQRQQENTTQNEAATPSDAGTSSPAEQQESTTTATETVAATAPDSDNGDNGSTPAPPAAATAAAEQPSDLSAATATESVDNRNENTATPTQTEKTTSVQADSAPAAATPEDATEEKKPTRRRRTTRKKEAEADTQADNETAAAPEDATEEKKPTRRRRTTRKKEAEANAQADSATAEAPEEATEEKKPTRRRRTTRKKEAETDVQADNAATAAPEEATEEKKPIRRRRTTTKKEAEQKSDTAADAQSSPSTADKPTPPTQEQS